MSDRDLWLVSALEPIELLRAQLAELDDTRAELAQAREERDALRAERDALRGELGRYTLPWTPEETARRFHAAYEAFAPMFGYATRRETAVPWEQVPKSNKALMIAVIRNVLIEQAIDAARAKE